MGSSYRQEATMASTFYRTNDLSNPQDIPTVVLARRSTVPDLDTLLTTLNEHLDDPRWHFDREPADGEPTWPEVVPIQLTWSGGGDEPTVTDPAQLLPLLRARAANVSLDSLVVGAPAYKPNALSGGEFGRVPVSWLGPEPPAHRPGVRRPVVALLDTGIGPHPWLPEASELGGDGFWVDARKLGWNPGNGRRVPERVDVPDRATLDRPLGEYEGHGTFLAGLIRQLAPDAQVLMLHVM